MYLCEAKRRTFLQSVLGALSWLVHGRVSQARSGQPTDGADGRVQPTQSSGTGRGVAPGPATTPRNPELVRKRYDLVVVGGGIAGTCAAISAARNGLKVALVHERPMLGGNSSSEVKLFPEDNSAHQPWIKEGGIHEEFHTEERVRNHQAYVEGTMNAHWDLVLYEWAVVREPNLDVYLNTHFRRVSVDSTNRIQAIYAFQLGTEKDYEFSADYFVDCTGTGVLGYRAGADYRWGREGREEYGEPEAPEQPDDQVMGNTLFFRAIDVGRPVPFKRPFWAAEFPTEEDLYQRGHSYIEGGYWWIEVGLPYHPIRDHDQTRHEGLRQLLGVWDHIKNKGDHGAENYGLEFVGFWPYVRECRRLLGEYVLTQQHVQDPKPLPDAVAYGCWGIDIHVPGGILNRKEPPYPPPRRDENWDRLGTMVYPIPLRALYSRNVHNLFMAGRPISCSYVAFASSRVLSTGAIVGEAVGVAAAICKRNGLLPRELVARPELVRRCQQLILKQGGHIPGVENEDDEDLARRAHVTASSQWWLEFPPPHDFVELRYPHAQLFPVSTGVIERVRLYLKSRSAGPIEVELGLRPAPHVWDFRADQDIARARATVPAGYEGWVEFEFNQPVDPHRLYYVHVGAHPGLFWGHFRETAGKPNLLPVGATAADLPGRLRWRPMTGGRGLVIDVQPRQYPYAPQNVVRGTNRPDKWTNIWISDPSQGLPAWIELSWDHPVTFNLVQLTFDTDQNRRVTLPLFRYPDCVRSYSLQAWTGSSWQELAQDRDNYMRRRVHRFDPVTTTKLRVRIEATNGAQMARLYEVRVYMEPVSTPV